MIGVEQASDRPCRDRPRAAWRSVDLVAGGPGCRGALVCGAFVGFAFSSTSFSRGCWANRLSRACWASSLAQHAVAIGVGPKEEAADHQVAGVSRFLLRNLSVVIGVGQLEEHLGRVLHVLNALNRADSGLWLSSRGLTAGSESGHSDGERPDHPESSTHGSSPFLNPNAWKSLLDSRSGSYPWTELRYPAVILPGRLEADIALQARCRWAHLQALRKAIRSASSWWVSC